VPEHAVAEAGRRRAGAEHAAPVDDRRLAVDAVEARAPHAAALRREAGAPNAVDHAAHRAGEAVHAVAAGVLDSQARAQARGGARPELPDVVVVAAARAGRGSAARERDTERDRARCAAAGEARA